MASAGLQEAMKTNVHDAELWDLITDVPKLSLLSAVVCAILNVGLAGSGTILVAFLAGEAWNKT
jgi:hypothetical protein